MSRARGARPVAASTSRATRGATSSSSSSAGDTDDSRVASSSSTSTTRESVSQMNARAGRASAAAKRARAEASAAASAAAAASALVEAAAAAAAVVPPIVQDGDEPASESDSMSSDEVEAPEPQPHPARFPVFKYVSIPGKTTAELEAQVEQIWFRDGAFTPALCADVAHRAEDDKETRMHHILVGAPVCESCLRTTRYAALIENHASITFAVAREVLRKQVPWAITRSLADYGNLSGHHHRVYLVRDVLRFKGVAAVAQGLEALPAIDDPLAITEPADKHNPASNIALVTRFAEPSSFVDMGLLGGGTDAASALGATRDDPVPFRVRFGRTVYNVLLGGTHARRITFRDREDENLRRVAAGQDPLPHRFRITGKTCSGCNARLSRDKFGEYQWRTAERPKCLECVADVRCASCGSTKRRGEFAAGSETCLKCAKEDKFPCSACGVARPRSCYTKARWHNRNGTDANRRTTCNLCAEYEPCDKCGTRTLKDELARFGTLRSVCETCIAHPCVACGKQVQRSGYDQSMWDKRKSRPPTCAECREAKGAAKGS